MTKNGDECSCFPGYSIRQQKILAAINNAIVINKNLSKIFKNCVLQAVGIKFVGIISGSSIISSQPIGESSSIILCKYLPFLQLHVAEF